MRRRLIAIGLIVLLIVVLAASVAGALMWWKFLHVEEQDVAVDRRFGYGSIGSELLAGIPYPILWVLPRVFPDLVEKHATAGFGPDKVGHGGLSAFGMAWEQGEALPAGLSIEKLGVDRVTMNCALCHTAQYRLAPDDVPKVVFGGPAHTLNLQGLLRFLFEASHDRRFTAARLLPEIALHFRLDWLDWALYAAVLIPKTRYALRFGAREMAWMEDKPAWGPGRDDSFNLPKYLLTRAPIDDSTGNVDFPALWRLDRPEGQLYHWAGEARDLRAVTATSAFGIAALPGAPFTDRVRWLEEFMRALPPPSYPLEIDAALARRGEALFAGQCATCHARDGARTGTAIPLAEVGTDLERVATWADADAARMNRITAVAGVGAELQGARGGYVATPLTGVWLLGPYLHNGSVPTLRALLSPPEARPTHFYRGYDLLDIDDVGFISTGPEAEARGFRYDTSERGNGNGGHTWGTDLSEPEKQALIEYLKTL